MKRLELWSDKEHGIVVIKRAAVEVTRFDWHTTNDERYLIYDFHRMEVSSMYMGKRAGFFSSAPHYHVMEDLVRWPEDYHITGGRAYDDNAEEIVRTLLDMYNEVFGKLFPLPNHLLSVFNNKRDYGELRTCLIVMWYLVQYPHVVYVINHIPSLVHKIRRMFYLTCYGGVSWSAIDVFDFSKLLPYEMLRVSPAVYKALKNRSTRAVKYAMSIYHVFGTDTTLRLLNMNSDHTLCSVSEFLLHSMPFTRRIVRKSAKVINFVRAHRMTIIDHCNITNTRLADVPLKLSVLVPIVRDHEAIALREARVRTAAEKARREEALNRLKGLSALFDMTVEGYRFVTLTKVKDFATEGKIMHNCVSGYVGGDYPIISMRLNDRPIIDIQYDHIQHRIIQKFQACNRSVTKEQDKIINKWLKQIR